MEDLNREENIVLKETYGIKANLRITTSNVIYPIEFLRKIGIFFAITIRRLIVSILAFFGIGVLVTLFLMTSPLRAKFLWLPTIIIFIALLMLLCQYAFINPSYGSFFSVGSSMANQLKEFKKVIKGKMARDRDNDIEEVDETGLIKFKSGSFGKVVSIDGSTSLVAFPSEIRDQERRAIRYHNTRERTTAEIDITSSQKQNADKQINNTKHLIRANTHPAIIANQRQEEYFLANKVNGKKSTIIQYKLLRDDTQKGLELTLEHLYRYEAEGYYYSVIELGKEETEEVLRDIYFLK